MRPPLTTHTVLQNRYRIVRVLGQGGFGRTYLAHDQNRFNEYCVLKEFMPARGEPHQIQKAKELFKREAAVLYQLRHPQIPQFHALFEQEQRLFLVQDYVEGKNYRTILAERLRRQQPFTESEAYELLLKVLPVLEYIHSCGVIHRDISPDNLMLRQKDQMPVLIDFGVVKDIASRLQPAQASGATSVGKLGYAPSEQLQTGRVYPASDLYTLAVTVLVLLTGREPQELYDDRTLTWQWQQYVQLNPVLANVLSKMLSHRPGDRYQTAKEVLKALGELPANGVSPELPPVSMIPTVVARPQPPFTPPAPTPVYYTAKPAPLSVPKPSAWDSPVVLALVSIFLVLVTGSLSWLVVSWVMRPAPDTPTWDNPVVTSPQSSPSPLPTGHTNPLPIPLPLQLGTETNLNNILTPGQTQVYELTSTAPQQLTIQFSGDGLRAVLITPAKQRITLAKQWQDKISTGKFRIEVSNPTNSPHGYDLSLLLSELPPAAPTLESTPITLPEGATQTEVTARISPTQGKRFLFTAPPDQELSVELRSIGMATLTCRTPEGRVLVKEALYCTAQPTVAGTYEFDVTSTDVTNVTLSLTLRPPAGSESGAN
ncbi:MAG: serine/threonine-protein kinase [Gloeomargarita sp. DG_1_5_bins_55]